MDSKTVRHLLVAGVLVVVAAAAWALKSGGQPKRARDTAIPVAVAVAENGDFAITINAVGTAQALNRAEVRAQIDGAIRRITFTEGQAVRAGDLLAELDARPYLAALAEAQAILARD